MKKFFITVALIGITGFISEAQVGFTWTQGIGGTLDDQAEGTGIDAMGNVYTAGFFNGTVDFDPGA